MNNQEIHQQLITLTQLERKTLAEILELLRLNFKRKVFAKMGYSHLTKYMIKELGYSESAAWRRWNALKITEEMPEAKKLLESGALNLSTVTKLSMHMKGASVEEKRKALNLIKNKTIAESEKSLFELTGRSTAKQESLQRTSENTQRLSVILFDQTIDKMNRLKQLMQKTQTADVLNYALDCALKSVTARPVKVAKSSSVARVARGNLRQQVLKRDSHVCQYPGCDEKKYLQLDHRIPFSKGGITTFENMMVLCSTHNRFKSSNFL
jgi:hypothetical protein